MTALPLVWGATAEEVLRPYPADTTVPGRVLLMTRAITVALKDLAERDAGG